MNQSARRPLTRALFALTVAAAVLVLVPVASAKGDEATRNKKAFFDIRETPASQLKLHGRAADLDANPSAATSALKDSLGAEGFVNLDPLTSTVRAVGSTDGFLTSPSAAPASAIALGYAANNAAALGLTQQTLASLKLVRNYVSIDGTHHLFYQQSIKGVPVFGNGLKANVTKNGELINVLGSPLSNASTATSSPGISSGEAIAVAKRDAGALTVPMRSDSATQVYFRTVDGTRLAYQAMVGSGTGLYLSVVDANSGRLLYRRSLVNYANGLIWDNYPGAPVGGTQHSVSLTPWLTPGATTLTGPNTHVYSDVNDNNADDAGEDIPSTDAAGNFNYTFQAFGTPPFGNTINSNCTAAYPCSWDSSFPTGAAVLPGQTARGSWRVNRAQNGTQVFFFVNNFHDHLAAAPIGFTPAAGNFEGDDPIQAEPDDGAGTISGIFPDPNHTDNANMGTPPDGISPRMQMYLFNDPVADDPIFGGVPRSDPFIQGNGGDGADVVYHEYTHGLSNRLVVDADGNSTLGNIQAGSMGEAWSDWYAMDYLVDTGQFTDTTANGELRVGQYVGAGADLIRTQPMDCAVGSTSPACHGTAGAGPGGYTYGDFGKIIGGPEVHADGEIWGETLWDLRGALGSEKAEGLVTRAMELSPANPSYLDMRNSILQADQVGFHGKNHTTIWSVFAHRGMGYFAGAVNGDDSKPVENFNMPPPKGTKKGELEGVVTDKDTGEPVKGAIVAFGGHASGFHGDLVGVTKKDGSYKVKKILFGTYPDIFASGPGYDTVVVPSLTIGSPKTTLDFQIRRDWAALSGGGSIADFNGPDFTDFGCGPSGAIDQSEGNGWGSTTDGDDGAATGHVTPKFVVVKLPRAVDVSEIQVNPSNTCGDGGSAATRGWRVEVSSDGTTFTAVSSGVFYLGNRAKENTVFTGSQSNVLYVKFWMLNPQVPTAPTVGGVLPTCTGPADCGTDPDSNPGVALHCTPPNVDAFGGCQFMDMVELKVFGAPH